MNDAENISSLNNLSQQCRKPITIISLNLYQRAITIVRQKKDKFCMASALKKNPSRLFLDAF